MNIINYCKKNNMVNNFIVLLTGDTVSSLLGIVATALIVNAIGLKDNGIILMVQTYALFFDQIFNFKIFEGLIKFLSSSLYNKDNFETKSFIKQGVYLDFITAIIATIIGISCVNIGISIMGWSIEIKPYILIYMSTVLFNISGVCIGVLRIFNKFNYISYINVAMNLLRTILFLIGFVIKLKFNYYFFVELSCLLIKYLFYMMFSYKTLIDNELSDFFKVPLKMNREFLKFSINTNLASTLDLPVNTLTTFIMNTYLGFEVISIYKIFEKIGSLVGKFSSPLNQILYPELNKYIAENQSKKAVKLSRKIGSGIFVIGSIVLGLIIFTHKLWLYVFISDYELYTKSLYIFVLYVIFTNTTACVHSLFMALGYIKYIVPILITINSMYIFYLIHLINIAGLNGLILSLLIQAFMVVFVKIFIMNKSNYQILN